MNLCVKDSLSSGSSSLCAVGFLTCLSTSATLRGSLSLLPFLYKAADVNIDTRINPLDALLINRNFVGTVTSFKAGSWAFANDTIVAAGKAVAVKIKGICIGDVNGTFIPVK